MRAPRSRRCSPSRGRSTGGPRWRGSKRCRCRRRDSGDLAQRRRRGRRQRGARRVISPSGAACAISPRSRAKRRSCSRPATRKRTISASWLRSLPAPAPRLFQVRASGEDGRLLARQAATIEPGAKSVEVRLAMPSELQKPGRPASRSKASSRRARCCWSTSAGGAARSASPRAANTGGQPLLSENYYLERALGPFTEIRRGRADRSPQARARRPGLFGCRTGFADGGSGGRQMDRGRAACCCALPDRTSPSRATSCCRCGCAAAAARSAARFPGSSRRRLAPFAPDSPFAGLAIPADVTVSRQVLAEPDLDLASKTWARLADGTPLVTAEKRGQGWIVLVHTTANADWSNLALSGLFVEMLRRTVAMSQGVAAASEEALPPIETLDGFGRLQRAPPTARPISGKEIAIGDRLAAASARASTAPPTPSARSTSRPGSRELKPIESLPAGHRARDLRRAAARSICGRRC